MDRETNLLAEAYQQSIDLTPQWPMRVRGMSVCKMAGSRPPQDSPPATLYLGSHSSKALRVSSGDLVTFLVHLSLLAILCTCVSTAAWRQGRVNEGALPAGLCP